jgi:cytochrome c
MIFRWSVACLVALGFAASAAHAAGDAAAGEKTFARCKVCHQIGPTAKNAVGPELNGIVGRKSGSAEGYSYSDANKKSGITWTEDKLDAYLKSPQAVVPGTKMIFPGLSSEKDRANVIAYLGSFDKDGKKK